MMLTDAQKKKYVDSQGLNCPYCNDGDLEGGCMQGDGNWITMPVTCDNCNKTWQEIYTLTGILEE